MFYYKVIRTSRSIRFENYIYAQDRCFIIPIVSPTSPLGKALLSDDYLLLVSDALEKVNTDLIYVDKKDKNAYRDYIVDIRSWSERVADIKSIRDPMIVIKTAKEWELFIISDLDDDDPNETKKLLWGIISCIGPQDMDKKLKRFIRKRKLSIFYSNNAEKINAFLQVIGIAATVIAGSPTRTDLPPS
jgi:hypothetical protein